MGAIPIMQGNDSVKEQIKKIRNAGGLLSTVYQYSGDITQQSVFKGSSVMTRDITHENGESETIECQKTIMTEKGFNTNFLASDRYGYICKIIKNKYKCKNLNEFGNLIKSNNVENADRGLLAELIELTVLDVRRRTVSAENVVNLLFEERINLDFTDPVKLKDVFPYSFHFSELEGTGDTVAMGEAAYGSEEVFPLKIYGTGWQHALWFDMFNKIHEMSRVTEGVSTAYTRRNNDIHMSLALDPNRYTDEAYQITAYQPGPNENLSLDEIRWQTLKKVRKQIAQIKNPINQSYLSPYGLDIVCSRDIAIDLEDIMAGRIYGTDYNRQYPRVEGYNSIIPYEGETYTWKKKAVTYKGIQDYDYPIQGAAVTSKRLIVKVPYSGSMISAVKRPLTLAVGPGEVLALTSEKRSWHFCNGAYILPGFLFVVEWPMEA